MAAKSLVEIVRDSKPGFNTVITLDELAKFGLNVVVIGEHVKQKRYLADEEGAEAWEIHDLDYKTPIKIIDRTWVESLTDPETQEKELRAKVDKAKADYQKALSKKGMMRKYEEKKGEYERARMEYHSFKPDVLTRYLGNVDLIVAPCDLLPLLKQYFPDTGRAIALEANSHFSLSEPAARDNYVRVVMRNPSDEGNRIDGTTVQLLFEPGNQGGLMSRLLSREYDEFTFSHLSDGFYDGALGLPRRQKVKRTPIESLRQKRIRASDPSNGITNFFSYGGNRRGKHISRGEKLLDDFWKQKGRDIVRLYDDLWLKPINSLEQIHDRQTLISALVEDQQHFESVSELERRINAVLEPFFHLSGMMNHATANILHSKWGAPVQKQAYFDDFKFIASEFIKSYKELREFPVIDDGSREMTALIAPMRYLLDSKLDGTVRNAYEFVRKVMKPKPQDFAQLWSSIEFQLGKANMMLDPQLEKFGIEYSTQPDPPRRPRRGMADRFVRGLYEDELDDFLFDEPEQPAKLADPKGNEKRTFSIRRKLLPEQKALLEKMQDKFYTQNPVTKAQKGIDYISHVSSQLAAYLGLARFIKNNKWVKPEIVPAELGLVDIVQGYYPFLDGNKVVANDTHLNAENAVEIIEGTNMGGKTIDAKKTMFIATVALTGNYVPAKSARISQFERVRYRIKDTGGYGTGAFAADLRNIEGVFSEIGRPILVGLDETFTSTNAREGEAMTHAIIMRMVEAGNARAVITSHYPTLQSLQGTPGVFFSHFEFDRINGQIVFSHIKKSGANLKGDYALAIAEREHLHPVLLAHAREYQERMGGQT
ncbi:MAG: hypothetical protein AABX51_08660 [Nanoarchaeota archaeon]